jgi:phage/plasmid-associated DNA primase
MGDFRANPDRHLGDKLFSEREAIFHKLVQYAIKWYKERLPDPPAVVTEETASWREETDAVARFMREKIQRIEGAKTSNGDAWRSWSAWCDEQNEKPGTANDFQKRLRSAGWEPKKLHIKGSSQRGYEHMQIDIDDGIDVEF